jgi:hypothetical protein
VICLCLFPFGPGYQYNTLHWKCQKCCSWLYHGDRHFHRRCAIWNQYNKLTFYDKEHICIFRRIFSVLCNLKYMLINVIIPLNNGMITLDKIGNKIYYWQKYYIFLGCKTCLNNCYYIIATKIMFISTQETVLFTT